MLLCSNLSWSPHIKSVCSKSRKVLGIIFFVTSISSLPKKLFSVYTVLLFFPTYPIVPLSGLLLFLLVILALLKIFKSSPSNSALKTGPLIIPLFSIPLTYLPSPLAALRLKLYSLSNFLTIFTIFPLLSSLLSILPLDPPATLTR